MGTGSTVPNPNTRHRPDCTLWTVVPVPVPPDEAESSALRFLRADGFDDLVNPPGRELIRSLPPRLFADNPQHFGLRRCKPHRAAQEFPNPCGNAVDILRFALPYNKNTPTETLKSATVLLISLLVFSKLWKPIVYSGFWDVRICASCVLMPETTAYLNDLLQPRKY